MKIIITENKRNEAITKWLDKNYGDLKRFNEFIFIDKKDGEPEKVFTYDNGWVYIINDELQHSLVSLLGVKQDSLKDIFIPWFKERYGLKVRIVQYTTHHCNTCGKYHPTKHHTKD